MTANRKARGATLIEAMFSMAVLMIGATGLAATHRQSQLVLGDAHRLTRATVVARDLATQIETWDFDDVRLSNDDVSNDPDIGDSAGNFAIMAVPPADHDEVELAGGGGWNGLPTSSVTDAGMERFVNVAYVDDVNGNGVPDAARIAIIVRWQHGAGWRRVVFPVVKFNPGDLR